MVLVERFVELNFKLALVFFFFYNLYLLKNFRTKQIEIVIGRMKMMNGLNWLIPMDRLLIAHQNHRVQKKQKVKIVLFT